MGQPAMPQFLDPTVGGLPGPSISELAGRFVAFVPKSYDPNAKGLDPNVPVKPAVTTDVIVLDGGNLQYGAAPKADPPRPNPTHITAIDPQPGPDGIVRQGAVFPNRVFSGVNVVSALRDNVGRGIVLGVVELGTVGKPGQNRPWNITPLTPSDPRRMLAHQWFAGMSAGTVKPHEGTEMTNQPQANPGPAAQQFYNTALPGPGYGAPHPATVPGYGQPQPAVPAAQGYAAAQQAPMQPNGYASAPVAQAPVQQAPAPVYGDPNAAYNPAAQGFIPQQAPPVAPVEFIPPGFEAIWPSATPEMKASILAGFQAQQQATAPGATPNPY